MVGHGQVVALISLLAVILITVAPSTAGSGVSYCSDSKPLGEPEYASCNLEHPDCASGCEWPDIHIRVWAEDGLEGSLTPLVTGEINFEGGIRGVCQDFGSCEGTFDMPAIWGASVFCQGYGAEDGEVLAITEVVNAPSAVHAECWIE